MVRFVPSAMPQVIRCCYVPVVSHILMLNNARSGVCNATIRYAYPPAFQ